jgi:hypothetical protein
MDQKKLQKQRKETALTQKGLYLWYYVFTILKCISELSALKATTKLSDKGKTYLILYIAIPIFILLMPFHNNK